MFILLFDSNKIMSKIDYITKLLLDKQALALDCWNKWLKIAYSTERINREDVRVAIEIVSTILQISKPEILFFDSPYAALAVLNDQNSVIFKGKHQVSTLHNRLRRELITYPFNSLIHQEREMLNEQQIENLDTLIKPNTYSSVSKILISPLFPNFQLLDKISIQFWMRYAWRFDFSYSILGCYFEQQKWEALQVLVKNCGRVFLLEKFCLVCDRPLRMLFNKNSLVLHAEAEPAVLFNDGYKIYAYNGLELPSKYGEVPPSNWNCKWLLEEKDASLRELLIQEIGLPQIYKQLPSIVVDVEDKTELLKIKISNFEDICLLKKVCNKSNKTIFLRVDPQIQSIINARKLLENNHSLS